MNQYAVTGASFPMHIADKEFEAFTLTDKDYVEIDGYIQSKIIELGKSQLEGMSASERQEWMQATIKAAAATGWGTAEGQKIINTPEGSLRLGWQMIKKKNKIDFSVFCTLARKNLVDSLLEIDKCFGVLNLDEEAKEASSEEPKSE